MPYGSIMKLQSWPSHKSRNCTVWSQSTPAGVCMCSSLAAAALHCRHAHVLPENMRDLQLKLLKILRTIQRARAVLVNQRTVKKSISIYAVLLLSTGMMHCIHTMGMIL
jgi:hypothetical protein